MFRLSKRIVRPQLQRFLTTATDTSTRIEPQVADNLMQIGTRSVFDFEHDQCKHTSFNASV